MLLSKGKKVFTICAAILPFMVVGTLFFTSSRFINRSKASNFSAVLNDSNSPTLTNGEGTRVDNKNVTWEYHNASDLADGHVSLGHQGYFGISSTTDWGYGTITGITVDFSNGENGELWLLSSIDGVQWSEVEKLVSNSETTMANNWNYIRFYSYDASDDPADVYSVSIDYDCDGINASEDSDLAKVDNLRSHSATTVSVEYNNVSPRGNSTEAVRLVSTNGRKTDNHDTIFNIPETTLGKICHAKIEYDYYYAEKRDPTKEPGFPSSLMANASGGFGTERKKTDGKGYTFEDIGGGWWHIECYVTGHLQLAEYNKNTAVTGILIRDNAIYTHDTPNGEKVGFIIIDNLRIVSYTPSAGIINAWDKVLIGGTGDNKYFIREVVCGTIISASYSCSDTNIARLYTGQKNNNGNDLCYIEGLVPGNIVVTITYVLGYNHQTVVIQTVTLKVSAS